MNAPKAWSCGEPSRALTVLAKKLIRTCPRMDGPKRTFGPTQNVHVSLYVHGKHVAQYLCYYGWLGSACERNWSLEIVLSVSSGWVCLEPPYFLFFKVMSTERYLHFPHLGQSLIASLSGVTFTSVSPCFLWVFVPIKGTPPQPHTLPFPQPNYSSSLNRYFSKDMANKQWKDAQQH